MTKEKHCIQVMIQPIICKEMLNTTWKHRGLLDSMMENKQKKKGGIPGYKGIKHNSCNLGQPYTKKKNTFSYYSSSCIAFD